MSYLIDTNVLLRLAQPNHPMHQDALNAVTTLHQNEDILFIIPQNLIEFWAVATRPLSVNGLDMTIAKAAEELAYLKRFFRLKPDTPEIFAVWKALVIDYQVMGKNAYDTRLVAAMVIHKISHLLTFNTEDFNRFTEIATITPQSTQPY